MLGQRLPFLTGIARIKQRPTTRSDVHAGRRQRIRAQRVPIHTQIRVPLWQSLCQELPVFPPIPAAGYAKVVVRIVATVGGFHRDGEQRLLFGGGSSEGEPEARGRAPRAM